MNLEDAASHLEIQQAIYRVSRGIDRGEAEMIASAFHADGRCIYGASSSTSREFAARAIPQMDVVGPGQHNITNILISVRGDVADVESYYFVFHPTPDGHSISHGRYLDRFERRQDAWLIAERHVIIDFGRMEPADPSWSRPPQFPQGGRREADPSFARFKGIAQLKD